MSRFILRAGLVLALALGSAHAAPAQGFLHKLKDKVKEKAQERVDQHEDQAAQAVVDKADAFAICVVTDLACIQRAKAAGKQVKVTDAGGQAVSTADSAAAMTAAGGSASSGTGTTAAGAGAESQPPGTGAWLNYDFVPGDKVLFYDDFADDHVGDLPTHEDITEGNVTIVDVDGTKFLRTLTGGKMWITLPEKLPRRFTIEATYYNPHDNNPLSFIIGEDGSRQLRVWCYHASAGVSGTGPNGDKESHEDAAGIGANDLVHCRFMVDGGYVKAYLNEQRLAQLNGLVFDRPSKILVEIPFGYEDDGPTLVTEIRIAEGGRPLWDALSATGRVATHGILFATGSATIEGESTPTLKEIGDMLKAHPTLKLRIEGHTDAVGDSAANQALSEQRAAAVAQYLEQTYGIAAARLTTRGYGATKPVASNDTPEGRQQNRRVELVKM